MAFSLDTVPSSLRRSEENSRVAQGVAGRVSTSLTYGAEARAISVAKSRFAPLPQEPEDARITGVTRSLTRRLLALNLPGSLRMGPSTYVSLRKTA